MKDFFYHTLYLFYLDFQLGFSIVNIIFINNKIPQKCKDKKYCGNTRFSLIFNVAVNTAVNSVKLVANRTTFFNNKALLLKIITSISQRLHLF